MGVPVTDPQYRHPAPTPQIGPGPSLGTPAFSKAQEGGCPPVLTLDVVYGSRERALRMVGGRPDLSLFVDDMPSAAVCRTVAQVCCPVARRCIFTANMLAIESSISASTTLPAALGGIPQAIR